jgi:hypothetical protein
MTTTKMLATFDAAASSFAASGARTWVYKPVPHIYHRIPAEEDLYALFRLGAKLVRRDIASSIRLDRRLKYAKGRKAAVKAAAEAGWSVARSEDFEWFVELQAETLARHGAVPVHSARELGFLASSFPDNIKLFAAEMGGSRRGGIVVFETSEVAHTQYIASSAEGRELGAVDVIADWLLADYEGTGKPWFDFGTSTLDNGHTLNEGLVRNKESYGARGITYDWYELAL